MRILCWTGTYWPQIGGVEVLLRNFLPGLRERGHDIVVVTENPGNLPQQETDDEGFTVYRYPFWHTLQSNKLGEVVSLIRKITVLKQQFRPDLVHLHTVGHTSFFHLNSNGSWSCPSLVTIHGSTLPEFGGVSTTQGKMLDSADWVATCSQSLLSDVRRSVPEILEKSSCISNGLPGQPSAPVPLQPEPGSLLCIGRLVREKGFDLAITAFASIAGLFPGLHLTIVGDGVCRDALERQVRDSGLEARVRFCGWVPPDEVPALINDASIVLIPSRREAFGLVALQAGQLGRPVVATAVGGLPEIIVDGETGVLLPPEDVERLAAALTFLLQRPEAQIRMGTASRRHVRASFSWQKHMDSYDLQYRRLIDARKHQWGLSRQQQKTGPGIAIRGDRR